MSKASSSTDKNISIVIQNHFFSHNKDKPKNNKPDDKKKVPQIISERSPFETEPAFLTEIKTKLAEKNLYQPRLLGTRPFSQNFSSVPYQNMMMPTMQPSMMPTMTSMRPPIETDGTDADDEEEFEDAVQQQENLDQQFEEIQTAEVNYYNMEPSDYKYDTQALPILIAEYGLTNPRTLGFTIIKKSKDKKGFPSAQGRGSEVRNWFSEYHRLLDKYKKDLAQ